MKKSALILIIILGIVIAVVGFRLITGKEEIAASIDDMQKQDGIPVNATVLKPATFERWRTFSGSIEGKEQAVIYANIPARVKSVRVKQGDKIGRGKTLIRLDPLSASQTYSTQNVARVQVEDAQRMYDRMKPLYKAGAISQEDFDQVKSALKMAKAGLTDAASMTVLRSPIRGTLTDLRVNPGDRVDPNQTLAVVADVSGAKVILNVSQSDVEELKIGQPVVLGNDKNARNNNGFDGKISKISLSADMQTRLFRVEVEINDVKKIRLGTLRYVQVETYVAENALYIPLNALVQKNGETYVFVITSEGKSEKRLVKSGLTNKASVEILSGLSANEQIVVWGQNRLRGGEKIKVIPLNGENENQAANTDA